MMSSAMWFFASFFNTEGGQPKKKNRRKAISMYKKDPKEPIFWSGQLEPTCWRGAVAGGALIFTYIGGCGNEPAMWLLFFVGFWCFGAQGVQKARH